MRADETHAANRLPATGSPILGDPELMAQIKQGQAELDRGEDIPLDQVRRELGL